jgi:hypothetical protein
MVVALFLLATQLAVGDSVYSSEALRSLVAEAAAANRGIPATLATYRARAESEIAFLQAEGDSEQVAQVEQIESELRWRSPNRVEQRVIGYRAATPALAVGALSYLRRPWIAPTLYGNHLRILLNWRDVVPLVRGKRTRAAIHPLADERDGVYRFDGGDTVQLAVPDHDTIRVIRIRVTPWVPPSAQTLLFRGELDVDPLSKQVVRMRGQLVVVGQHPSRWVRLVRRGIQTVAVAELVSTRVDGYWLPAYQRLEIQARSPLAKDLRAALRIVTRFRHYTVNDVELSARHVRSRPAKCAPECLAVARRDSLGQFTEWMHEAGVVTAAMKSSDFDDVTSDAWGPPRPKPERSSAQHADSARPSRVKRAYAGISDQLRALDHSGLSVSADAGRTWSDGTTRGALALQWNRAPWRSSLLVEQPLMSSGGLLPALGDQSSVVAFRFGTADVNRGARTLALARELGGPSGARVRLDAGPASDPAESMWSRAYSACAPSGLVSNYAAEVNRNLRSTVVLELHPDVNADRRTRGIGAGLTYEHVDCELRTQRIEGRLLARSTRGVMTYAARLDGASLTRWRLRPPQLLAPDAYDGFAREAYERLGSNRAALLRLSATYELPRLAVPVRSLRWIMLPSASPTVSLGLQSGWSDSFSTRIDSLSGRGSRGVLASLATSPLTTQRVEGQFRSAVSLTVQPFGGAIGVGVARKLDHGAGWGLVFSTDTRW